ncbi:MAG: DNA-formamidopyrimidine glycosylase family protein [Anaerolineales bacterium]|jgi:formamidopyrimidine-DNA glycosylase
MPELPDVEIRKRYIDSTCLHQKIASVEVNDPIVLDGLTPQSLGRALADQSFESTQRHGKYLFVELNDHKWMSMHFGMTGDLKYFKKTDEKPDYEQVLFHFKNGYQLAYVMPRKLGEIRLIDSVDTFLDEKELGPDALDLDFDKFYDLLADRRGMIKSTLMNQEVLAGLGNVYSDEILFQARIYPRAQISDLNRKQLRAVNDAMQEVLKTVIEQGANPGDFPPSYLTPHRSEGESCPRCGGEIQKIEVSGRSGFYCPHCQSKKDK